MSDWERDNMAEQHLFILWEKARHKEKEILDDLKTQFEVLKEYEIFWNKNKFKLNLSSFYSEDFEFDTYQTEIRGKGPLLAVLVEDSNPDYENGINQNTFKFKHKWRKILGSFTVHGTDTVKQMKHDICLLTGKSIADILATENLDGTRVQLHQNVPCVDGWKSLEHIFYVLNETVNYVILRPSNLNIKTHKMATGGDIDFLTDDFFDVRAVLCACKDVDKNAFDFFNWIKHDEEEIKQLFHPKFVGDNYYDRLWQSNLLKNKKLNKDGIYILDEEDQFWTLLYHGLIHKQNFEKYNNILKEISQKLNLPYKNNKNYLLKVLNKYLKKHGYKIGLHLDSVAGHLETQNIRDYLKKRKPDLYYFSRGELGSLIISEKLIYLQPELATELIKYYNRIVRLDGFLLSNRDTLYKEHYENFKKNELAWFYKRRFGKVVRTTFYLKNDELYIKRELLNNTGDCGNSLLQFVKENNRKFINGYSLDKIIRQNKDDREVLLQHLEIYIGEIFRRFSINNELVDGRCWDLFPTNCLIDPAGNYNFIDFEYTFNGGIDKSYLIWRIVKSYTNENNFADIYDTLTNLFNIPSKKYWCQFIETKAFDGILKECKESDKYYWFKYFIQYLTCIIPLKNLRRNLRNKLYSSIFGKDIMLFRRYFR